jgi:hypothetical protein
MKKLLFVLVIILISLNVIAQERTVRIGNYSLSDVTVTSGKGALTSGFDTRFSFKNQENDILFLVANNDRIVINVGKKIGNFSLIQSIGVFKNIPWTGPMIIYEIGPLDVMTWTGIGFAKDNQLKEPSYKPQFFFNYESIGLTFLKNNRIGASMMLFATEPINWFISYKRTINIGEKSKLFAEVTYNHALNIPMFVIGYNLKLK